MQIERKPRRWPWVSALLASLLFCLSVPRFWQVTTASSPNRPAPGEGQSGDGLGARGSRAPLAAFWSRDHRELPPGLRVASGRTPSTFDALPYWQVQAVDELLGILRLPNALWPDFNGEFRAIVDQARVGSTSADALSILSTGAAFNALPTERDRIEGNRVSDDEIAARLGAILQRFGTLLVNRSHDFLVWLQDAIEQPQSGQPTERVASTTAITPIEEGPSLEVPEPNRLATDTTIWATPEPLLAQLEELSSFPATARWAKQTLSLVKALTRENQPQQELMNALLRRIATAAEDAVRLGEKCDDDHLRAELLRAHWALVRRVDCWAVLHDIRLAAVEKRRLAARDGTDRLFAGPPLPEELPAGARTLNADLERYESSRDPAIARAIADSHQRLIHANGTLEQSLAEAVEQHYRNANIRIAVTDRMLNRLVGLPRSQSDPVRERIAGTPTFGSSHTLTESRVSLQPETGRWRMELEADGRVESRTRSDGGPAQLYSRGETDFVARKGIVVAPEGIHMNQTVVTAYNRNRLVGVTTDFDWVPLFGSYARGMAVNQYHAKRSQAKRDVEYKVAARAIEQLDRETLDRVDRLEEDIRNRFIEPLDRAGIEVTAVELTSTSERVVARLRVAGDFQLAGHTPRPRALSDSLASVQIHESAISNGVVALGLDGGRFTAQELQVKLRDSFPRLASEDSWEEDEDVEIKFAPQDAVQVRIGDGKLELLIAIDELRHGGRRIGAFIAHAFYAPVVNGLDVELARDGPLGFEGRLSSSDRARLYSIFKEVLADDRRLPILKLEDRNDERLASLMITQLVLEDGWLGLSIGPESSGRTAERSRSLR